MDAAQLEDDGGRRTVVNLMVLISAWVPFLGPCYFQYLYFWSWSLPIWVRFHLNWCLDSSILKVPIDNVFLSLCFFHCICLSVCQVLRWLFYLPLILISYSFSELFTSFQTLFQFSVVSFISLRVLLSFPQLLSFWSLELLLSFLKYHLPYSIFSCSFLILTISAAIRLSLRSLSEDVLSLIDAGWTFCALDLPHWAWWSFTDRCMAPPAVLRVNLCPLGFLEEFLFPFLPFFTQWQEG